AKDNHVAPLRFIQIVEPPSLIDRKIPNLTVLGFDAGNLSAGAGIFADRAHVGAHQNRGSVANVWAFMADVNIILVREQIITRRVHAALKGGGASGIEEHDVFAVLRQLTLVAGAE